MQGMRIITLNTARIVGLGNRRPAHLSTSPLHASRQQRLHKMLPSHTDTSSRHYPATVAAQAQPHVEGGGGDGAAQEGPFEYDVVVLGSGSGGIRTAQRAAEAGLRVAVIELPLSLKSSDTKGGVGGTCVLRGCVPKKLLWYGASYAEALREARAFGWDLNGDKEPTIDWERLMVQKQKELIRISDNYRAKMKESKIDLLEGRGRVAAPHTLEVTPLTGHPRRVTAANLVVATGAQSLSLPIEGAEHCINSDYSMDLRSIPKKMVVVGGGYIGVEQASIFHAVGAEVHLLYKGASLLPGFDWEMTDRLAKMLTERGIRLHSDSSPTKVVKGEDGMLTVHFAAGEGGTQMLEQVETVLMAVGRKPKTSDLGLEDAGVALTDKGALDVDPYLRSTSCPWVWGVGDVTGRIQLTPVAVVEGEAVAASITGKPTVPDLKYTPSVAFAFPPYAFVGLTEEAAAQKYDVVEVFESEVKGLKNQLSGSPARTVFKLLVDGKSDKVLALHALGDEAAEIVQVFELAMKAGLTKSQLDSSVGLHPTMSEELLFMRRPRRIVKRAKLAGGVSREDSAGGKKVEVTEEEEIRIRAE